MPTRQRRRILYVQALWTSAGLVGLALLGQLSLELFFVVSYLGFLAVVLSTTGRTTSPALRRRLLVLVVLGMVVFGVVFVGRVLQMLPRGMV